MKFPIGMVAGMAGYIFRNKRHPRPEWQKNVTPAVDTANPFRILSWLQVLKFTPLPHLASFVFGVVLAELDEMMERASRLRLLLGLTGFAGTYGLLALGPRSALRHHGRRPADAALRLHFLGLAGENPLARALSWRPLVFVGEASYCLYLLHFNLWTRFTTRIC